ncbi:MAG TPA: hypothetical protein PK970_11025 [Hyphomicrobiaceae bacterium]|nr:hypothetical protein [Hyphomicrobiaceae bacterium]
MASSRSLRASVLKPFALLSAGAGAIVLAQNAVVTAPASGGLFAGLQAVERTWGAADEATLRLTSNSDTGPHVRVGSAVATEWQVPSLGRIAIGRSVSISVAGASGRDLVVTEIDLIEGPDPKLVHRPTASQTLLLTLRLSAAGSGAVETLRMLVSGTPAVGPSAMDGGVGRAL